MLSRAFAALAACAALFGTPAALAQTPPPPTVQVLYDAPSGTEWDKLSFAYAIMLRNLLGHFDAQVSMVPVQQYTPGSVEKYSATFYLGGAYDHQLPAAFLADAMATTKPLVWFKYNLWQLAWNPTYNFTANKGITLTGLRGLSAEPSSSNPNPPFFDTVKYKGLDFVKYYTYDSGRNVVNADPDIGAVKIADATKAQAVVKIASPRTNETLPYITRAGNFWYVADLPFSFIGPRDRYLVFSDLLHDMLGSTHTFYHKAMVRLEDVGAMVSVQAMKTLSDYLSSKAVPFSVAVIPHYVDPMGLYNGGVPQEVALSQATNLQTALNYARDKGGEMVMHGFTHQYG
ncbi:MAG: papd-like protein, partial [Ramlibacter sp.]|nr:papd-like protein [Ramlibacter sp.]